MKVDLELGRSPVMRLAIVCAAIGILAACAGDAADDSGDHAGRQVALDAGCASCHGTGFTGGVGPSWTDLFGSTVALADGTEVVADRDYLVESIRDPDAKRVAGFTLAMPANALTDAEVAAIVDYIVSLAENSAP